MTEKRLASMLRAHANIKARRAEEAKKFKAIDGPLKSKLDLVEVALLQMMNEVGTSQLKVPGLAIVIPTKKIMPNCKDWAALWEHMIGTGDYDLVARRLSSKHVKEYMDTHEDALPPGITIHVERGVSVRRQN